MLRILPKLVLPVLCLVLFLSPGQAFASAEAGDLVKCEDFTAVYFLAGDGKRYVFPRGEFVLLDRRRSFGAHAALVAEWRRVFGDKMDSGPSAQLFE